MPEFTLLRSTSGFPARYRAGLRARNGKGAVGWQIPQPWVTDEKGDAVRLDDVIGGRWGVVHRPSSERDWRAAGVPGLRVLMAGSTPCADSSSTSTGLLTRWIDQQGASVAVVRPDGFVYAGAAEGQPLPPPPPASRHASRTRNDQQQP